MSKNSIKDAALSVLSKGQSVDKATEGFSADELVEFETLIKSINKKTGDGRYGSPNPDVKVKEVLKTDKNGQWSLDKAIKPGPSLDYSQFNKKPDYAAIEAAAPKIDYKNNPVKKPEWSGAADKAKAINTKIESERSETAAETIARRQKMSKGEGVNSEPELTASQQKRMVAKGEMSEPHEDDPHHEEKEKKKAKKIKKEAEEILDMHKK